MCTYWEELLKIIGFHKNLVAADREGDWEGHLLAVQNLLPVFGECGSINYLRYASWYLEKMRRLPEEHPQVYAQFKRGPFVVSMMVSSMLFHQI